MTIIHVSVYLNIRYSLSIIIMSIYFNQINVNCKNKGKRVAQNKVNDNTRKDTRSTRKYFIHYH
jgi:hypothetical protein